MTIMSRSGAEFWLKQPLPKGVSYAYKDFPHQDWKYVTYKEINAKRKEKQDSNINRKIKTPYYKPGYIQVFYNDTTFFGGWWIYIVTNKKSWGINFRYENNPALVIKAMELYPCGVFPIYENFPLWAKTFAKVYKHKGFGRKKNLGLAKCRVHLSAWGQLQDIQLLTK